MKKRLEVTGQGSEITRNEKWILPKNSSKLWKEMCIAALTP